MFVFEHLSLDNCVIQGNEVSAGSLSLKVKLESLSYSPFGLYQARHYEFSFALHIT